MSSVSIPGLPSSSREPRSESVTEAPTSHQLLAESVSQENATNKGDRYSKHYRQRVSNGVEKLDTFSGVYVPTCLNVLSILMFLRFGLIIGQSGVIGTMGMLIASYIICFITAFSLSAIASNGTVRGGGAYYLISRSLGPEFGGAIGVVFYLGFCFNTSLNAVALVDCIVLNFGAVSGNWAQLLPESYWSLYLWATMVLVGCTLVCLAGSSLFARASNWLLVILLVATLSIPVSALLVAPFESRQLRIEYTGFSMDTFVGNLKPHFTQGAAGSQIQGRETFQNLFGILFPATGGIFAGASMSGDLKTPSQSIPKGTVLGLITTFILYTLVILTMGATVTRASFIHNANVIQEINISGVLILAGEFASSFFSTLMGVIGSAKLLQALARDHLLPGLSIFANGSKSNDEPTMAIVITYLVAQVIMICDLNRIASFVTMTYLMTFLVMNLACFLLKISSAPNFRPSFHFFNWRTAFAGTIVSGAAMFFVDGLYAAGCVAVLIIIFSLIHYTTLPKSWGDVSQSLIYHQVRKYLLRLKQEHVKFWRPQILLLVNDPRRQYKLIQFCNSMKKGALYVLGHVIVTDDFESSVPEARRQQTAWTKYIDFSKIKAFVNISISPGIEWGIRNIILGAGLGGMRPNIVVLGLYNLVDYKNAQPLIDIPYKNPDLQDEDTKRAAETIAAPDISGKNALPTDSCRKEEMMSVISYVTVLEDLLLRLRINVAVARGFQDLEIPGTNISTGIPKKYIDLWPIQMSAEITSESANTQSVMTTNFDTYTLILQLGVILNTVPSWKKAYKLRVMVFVEYESEEEEERARVKILLENLRIEAEVFVFCLASERLSIYEIIVSGGSLTQEQESSVNNYLDGYEWWDELQSLRGKRGATIITTSGLTDISGIFGGRSNLSVSSFSRGSEERLERFQGLRKLLRRSNKKHTLNGLTKLGINLGMRSQRLSASLVSQHSNKESSGSESGIDSDSNDNSDASDDIDSEAVETLSEDEMDGFEIERDSQFQNKSNVLLTESPDDILKMPVSVKRDITLNPTSSLARNMEASAERPLVTKSSFVIPSEPNLKQPKSLNTGQESSVENLDTFPFPKGALQNSKKSASSRPSTMQSLRPSLSRHASTPKFTSRPVPPTRVATEDGPGPSIMFAETPSPPPRQGALPSAYRGSLSSKIPNLNDHIEEDGHSHQASSYATQALSLSFNDLPSRAQHLILNELIRRESSDTAVLFTTLPSPADGTSKSAEASKIYLEDLEILCDGCPPALMIHSNSMTVTMSL